MTTAALVLLSPWAGLLLQDPTPSPLPASQASAPAPLSERVSWGDFDLDGRLDALAVTAEGCLQLLANRPSGFDDVTESAGMAAIDSVSLALWGDYDGDGRADLFVGRGVGASRLLRNEGGSFVDVAAGTGLAIEEPVRAAHWLDEDGDGRLDLHVVTSGSNRIWRHIEGGFFEAVELPLEASAGSDLVSATRGAPEIGVPAAGPRTLPRPPLSDRTDREDPGSNKGASSRPLVGPPPTVGGATRIDTLPSGCATSIRDQASPGTCLQASSAAVLGMLYPLTERLFVDEATGNVGIGTTSPAYRLHVPFGQIVSGSFNEASLDWAAIGGGHDNAASALGATICGGGINAASEDYSTIGGGSGNLAGSPHATIGGGEGNTVTGLNGTVGGGRFNQALDPYATVSGGSTNAASQWATVGGGLANRASAGGASVGGGLSNHASAFEATVGGGGGNTASGIQATVGGGFANTASGYGSFAAGRWAQATHAGSFVWGDSQEGAKHSSAIDQFNVYAEGGLRVFAAGVTNPSMTVDAAGNVGIGTAAPAYSLHVVGKLVSGTDTSAPGVNAVVSGGRASTASGGDSTVSGGSFNQASGAASTIGGGFLNRAEGDTSVVAGGMYNHTFGPSCAIGGGYGNSAVGERATVGGGWYNRCASDFATISGGSSNRALATGAAVGGGAGNEVSGSWAAIPGGASNLAAEEYSFAAGRRAQALHAGSFVWGDGQDVDKPSSAADQFNVFAEGGVRVFAAGVVKPALVVDPAGKVGVGTSAPAFTLEVDGTAAKPGGGSWSVSSDARLKKDVEDLDRALATLLALRGVSFEYIDPAAIGELEGRRIGFLAQEVERVLPDWVAENETGTKYLTIRGFEALAVEALRELEHTNRALEASCAELLAEGAAKDARIAELEASSRELSAYGRQLEGRVARLEQAQAQLEALSARLAALER